MGILNIDATSVDPVKGIAHSVQQKSNAKNVPSPESELM